MNARLEAFCDGVFAIALTLLVIEVRLPEAQAIHDAHALWGGLRHLGPVVFAFLLSFTVIFITWVNHRNTLRLVNRSSISFLYANGVLLLGVVCIPFTTSLLGAFVLTPAAAPAVALYDAVLAAQAIGWLAITRAALNNRLSIGEAAAAVLAERRGRAYAAFGLYGALAVVGLWLPLVVAVVTTATWIFWLVLSLREPAAITGAA